MNDEQFGLGWLVAVYDQGLQVGVVLHVHVLGIDGLHELGLQGVGDCACDQGGEHDDVLWLVMTKDYRLGWCCLSMFLLWMNYNCLGYRGLETVLVIQGGGEHDGCLRLV